MVDVVIGALVRDGQVLVAHRSPTKRAYPDVWDLPGGVVERGESELGALERELREELGVHIVTASTSRLCRVTARPAGDVVVVGAWLVCEWSGEPVNLAPEEHVDIRWVDLDGLPPLAHPLVRTAVVEVLRRAW